MSSESPLLHNFPRSFPGLGAIESVVRDGLRGGGGHGLPVLVFGF